MWYKIIYDNFIGYDTEDVFNYKYIKISKNKKVPLNKCKINKQIKFKNSLNLVFFDEDKVINLNGKKGIIKLINDTPFIQYENDLLLENLNQDDIKKLIPCKFFSEQF